MKEGEVGLVVGIGKVIREKMVSGSNRQLSVCLSKLVILLEDHSGTALFCWKVKNVGIGPEQVRSLRSREVRLHWRGGIW